MSPHPFHKASFRPHTFMGAERKPMLILILVCILLIASFKFVSLIVAVCLWLIFHPLLFWAGTYDPNLIMVYLRNNMLCYPRHIPAFTTPFRTAVGYKIPSQNKLLNR